MRAPSDLYAEVNDTPDKWTAASFVPETGRFEPRWMNSIAADK